jgi:hypothetical protein
MDPLTNQRFEIELDGLKLNVQNLMLEEQVFRIIFPDGREPLIITPTKIRKGKKVWVSLPQGRQMEAEWIGAKIGVYLKDK